MIDALRFAVAHVDEGDVPWDSLDPALRPYIVHFRNGTPATTFDEVVVFYKRAGKAGVVFLHAVGFPPGAVRTFQLDRASALESYTIGVFLQGGMVARLPDDGSVMTPAKAAAIDQNRVDEFTDSWAVVEDELIDLSALTYTVTFRNRTPDTWDEVAVAYSLVGHTATIAETVAVAPDKDVTVDLGPADQVVGYTYVIFVDGLRVDWDPEEGPGHEQLQMPAVGLYNRLRALKEGASPDLDPAHDTWTIGDDV
jgi:hypothetical protein